MYQKLTLVGNLGRDPELRYTPGGMPIVNLSVATNHKWNNPEGEIQEETLWFRVSVFGKQAEACNEYLAKGHKVLVEGTLVGDRKTGGPRVYTRKDGTVGASFEVRATTIRFLSGKGAKADQPGEADLELAGGAADQLPF